MWRRSRSCAGAERPRLHSATGGLPRGSSRLLVVVITNKSRASFCTRLAFRGPRPSVKMKIWNNGLQQLLRDLPALQMPPLPRLCMLACDTLPTAVRPPIRRLKSRASRSGSYMYEVQHGTRMNSKLYRLDPRSGRDLVCFQAILFG
jgi:hypothetical protein